MPTSSFLTDPLWYKDAVIYELHVRSFYDANNDGFGEFAGLREKLPYLESLGVNTLWLLPFLESPLRDDGYDTADYYSILPVHGTLDEFKAFLDDAHNRGMRVVTELVLNHTSDQHPWFQQARNPASDKHDWYVWSETADKYSGVRIIFTDSEPSNWSWDAKAQKYYWHRFFSHQPDLNFDNPDVRAAMEDVMFFWLDMGVDGLRLDAVPYLFEREGTSCENLPETLHYMTVLRSKIEERYGPGKVLLAEANQWPEDTLPYFADGKGVQMAFNFPIMPRMYLALMRENRRPLVEMLRLTEDIPEDAQWAIFLRNHDELTLEMVTDEERDYMWNAYAADPRFRINVGIRRRLAPLLEGDRRRIELMTALVLSLKGSPVLYYGDEIGMGDDPFLGDRNGVRTPMQWSPDKNGGFSRASHHRLFMPAIDRGPYSYEFVNVEDAEHDAHSLLHFTRRILAVRRKHSPLFGRGEMHILDVANPAIFAFVREFEDDRVLVVANLSRFAQSVLIPTDTLQGTFPVEVISQSAFPEIGPLDYHLSLAPYGYFWFSLEPVSEQKQAFIPEQPAEEAPATLPELSVPEGLHNLLIPTMARGDGISQFEAILPDFLIRQRWFGGKGSSMPTVRLHDAVRLARDPSPVYLTLLEVTQASGKSLYLLPLLLADEEEAARIQHERPGAALAYVEGPQSRRLLADGAASPEFWRTLARWWAAGQKGRSLQGFYVPTWQGHPHAEDVRILTGEQTNSSAILNEQYFVKLFRRVESGFNPEAELLDHLTATGFPFVPQLRGTVAFQRPEQTILLGIVQQAVDAERDGWAHALQLAGRALDRIQGQALPRESEGVWADEIAPELIGFARTLGVRTAELHLALAKGTTPDLTPEPLDAPQLGAITARVHAALDATRPHVSAEAVDDETWQRTAAALEEFNHAQAGQRIRVHGDYHLGQTLVAEDDVFILDFEGEPTRSLEERRQRDSPLRDVAGMLRSIDYAVHWAAQETKIEQADAWTNLLVEAVQQAFLAAYAGVSGIDTLLPGPAYVQALLRLYLIEKALYEVRYEASHRPEWLWLPVRGLKRLLGA